MNDDVLVTPERKERGRVVTTARTAHAGGRVAEMGQVDRWHSYLDFLFDKDLLGNKEREGLWRRDAGHDLMKLYTRTHRSDRSNVLSVVRGGDAGEGPVSEEEVGTAADRYMTEWLKVSTYLVAHKQFLHLYILNVKDVPSYPMDLAGINEMPHERACWKIERWKMQCKVVETHVKAFEVANIRNGVWNACDAIPQAMKRAHDQVWCDK